MPITKSFKRKSGFRDAILLVIATEGERTEQIYFGELKTQFHKPSVHIEVLKRSEPGSSPRHVLRELEKFKKEYHLQKDDQLWMVIDRDRWTEQTLSDVAGKCIQKGFFLAVSNPCFELWLLLHITDLPEFERDPSCKHLEELLREELGSYNKSRPDTSGLLPHIADAISRAKELDTETAARWPQDLGTRVYLLVEKIIR